MKKQFDEEFSKLSLEEQENCEMDLIVYGRCLLRVGSDGKVTRAEPRSIEDNND